jgi:hypothetical protein
MLSFVEGFGSMTQGTSCSYGCLAPDTLLQRFYPPTRCDSSHVHVLALRRFRIVSTIPSRCRF